MTDPASGLADLEITVDSRERYAYTFADRQVSTVKARLASGDYGLVRDGALLATVERKSLGDLVSSLTTGKLKYQLTELASVPRAAVVVEDRYSGVFKLEHVRPAVVADALAECQVQWPMVPIVFCETRKLAQEWTYRFLAAAVVGIGHESAGEQRLAELAVARPLAPPPPTPAAIRAWARANGYDVPDRGRVRRELTDAYATAQRSGQSPS